MRVALVGPYLVDPGNVGGGVETSFFNLVEGLAAFHDLELHVVTFVERSVYPRRVDAGPMTIHLVRTPRRLNNLTFHLAERRILGSLLAELAPDVVHAQNAVGYGYVCLKAAGRTPVVVSVHGIVREERKLLGTTRARLRMSLADVSLEKYCIRNSAYLVQPTPYPQEYFGSEVHGFIVDVGNGVRDAFFAVESAPEPGRVLYAGGIMERKRLVDLVEAIGALRSSVPGVTLRVAGGVADTAYMAKVQSRIDALGLAEVVALLGSLTPEQMLEEYRRASVFALPSAQETSPMAIGEAMATGVPVVATDVGGVRYIVDDGRTGFLVAAGDVDELTHRLRELLIVESVRRAFSEAARAFADQRFRCVDVATRVRAVYERAVQPRTLTASPRRRV